MQEALSSISSTAGKKKKNNLISYLYSNISDSLTLGG